jgi:hypothetical protein
MLRMVPPPPFARGRMVPPLTLNPDRMKRSGLLACFTLASGPGCHFVHPGYGSYESEGGGTPADAKSFRAAPCGVARADRSALTCRRSAAALAVGAFAPLAQFQARLPGTRLLPQRFFARRALPVPACPSPVEHPTRRPIGPAGMMPRTARARLASPHASTALRSTLRHAFRKASLGERRFFECNRNRDIRQWKRDGRRCLIPPPSSVKRPPSSTLRIMRDDFPRLRSAP